MTVNHSVHYKDPKNGQYTVKLAAIKATCTWLIKKAFRKHNNNNKEKAMTSQACGGE